jgi:hypothetical protein
MDEWFNCDLFNIEIDPASVHDVGTSFGLQNQAKCIDIIEKIYEKTVQNLPCPPTLTMKIRLNSDHLVYVPPRRLSYSDKEIAKQSVNELLEKGIARPSHSEYAAPIVLVKKKNGDHRMCIDYRALNKITLKDNFPLPLIDDCIEFLGNKKCFSIIDLKNGFHQVKMDPESIKYTAFVTPFGQYEYCQMPFGLKNGPAVFQRWVSTIFRDFIDQGEIIVYIDDILIATETIDAHLKILERLFTRITQYGLEVKLPKCHFIQSQIDYLGYVADAKGIRPNDSHIKCIANYPQPTNVKTLQSCIGLFQYFRRFVPGFSRIAYPLTELLKKNTNFEFNVECIYAFEKLKGLLTSAPILAIYDPKRITEMHTDASSRGFGIIILQRQADEKMHPIAYYSKKASETEQKYHSFELETLAIIYGIRRFSTLLKGIPFKIITDCSALQMTLSKKNINPRIARWALELEEFDYTVVHRKGCQIM